MSKSWYPMINKETCIECGVCVKKCPHGVYDKGSKKTPLIIFTDGCIDKCHGCGNLCPTGSITYAGDNTGWTPPNVKVVLEPDGSCGCACSDGEKADKNLDIDFLYLDLNTCERCIVTYETLKEALNVLSGVFDTLGYRVNINSTHITSIELAEKYRFLSSPTIRVNGVDICNEVVESDCKDCGDLCGGGSVDCRVFVYEGVEYEKPSVTMIIDGILKAIYGQSSCEEKPYELPDNLKQFFENKNSCYNNNLRSDCSMKTMQIYEPAMCCPTGLCGVGIDPELMRVSTVLDTLKKNNVKVDRFNLTSFPQEFVKNTKVNERLTDEGVEVLPIIVVDGKIVITKRYPSNAEFIKLLELPSGLLATSDCCCDESETAKANEASGCCCGESGCC